MSSIGSQRELLTADAFRALQTTGTIIVDDRRRRPRYFDGRFLVARDLTSDQEYFLTRQADLGRLAGTGVISGLDVTAGSSTTSIRIARGYGITASGELLVVGADLDLDLADLAEIQRLDAAFGLAPLPRDPGRNRTGLYIVTLRPVEFTANPIAAYPTSITGPRETKDGDIVEGSAVTLVPYPASGTTRDYDQLRARAAYDVFVQNGTSGVTVDALPIAVVAIDRGIVQWVDPYLVRREVGAEHLDVLGLGVRHRAVAEAQLLQYDAQLGDVLRARAASGRAARFAASEHFFALPPIGRMPVAAINPSDFTQFYFPSEYSVDLTIIPSDEVPPLVDDALALPPLDLQTAEEERRATNVVVMVPVPRVTYRTYVARLSAQTVTLRPAMTGPLARRLPIDVLRGLRFPPILPPLPVAGGDAVWRELLQSAPYYWYARRRSIPYRQAPAATGATLIANEMQAETTVLARLDALGFSSFVSDLRSKISVRAFGDLLALLGGPRFSDMFTAALINELKRITAPDRLSIAALAARYGDPHLGEGIARLGSLSDALSQAAVVSAIELSGALPELDRVLFALNDDGVKQLGINLKTLATQPNPGTAVADFAYAQLGSLPQ